MRYVGVSTKETIWPIIIRGKTNTLPHLSAVLGIVCRADINCQNTREEDSAKSGMTQDVFPQQVEV